MTERTQLARPMLGAAAGFHTNHAWGAIGKVLEEPGTLELDAHNFTALALHPVELKHAFCDIYTDNGMLHLGPSSCL